MQLEASARVNEFYAAEKNLLVRAAAWGKCPALADCTPEKLLAVTQPHGLEFATAVLYDRVLNHPEHRAFFQRVQARTEFIAPPPTLVGIIPGAFYLEHKNTGADGARVVAIVETLGCRVERVPLESFGSLARNAKIIADWLAQKKGERIVLISLSKGSADLKLALGLPGAAELFANVSAWISFSGLPQGTPLVDWLRRHRLRQWGVRLLLRLRGQRYAVIEELRRTNSAPLWGWPTLPEHLQIVHVVGFPLRQHLAHPWAHRAYERLAPLGPNDGGGFLLGDVTKLPGIVFPVWGADHYLQPGWDVTPLLRQVLAEAIFSASDFRHASQSANQPIKPPASKSTA